MRNKLKTGILMLSCLMLLAIVQNSALSFDYKKDISVSGAGTAGASGFGDENYKNDVRFTCKSSECTEIIKSIDNVYAEGTVDHKNLSEAIESIKDSTIISLKNNLVKMEKAIEAKILENPFLDYSADKAEWSKAVQEFLAEASKVNPEIATLKAKVDLDYEQKGNLMLKLEKAYDDWCDRSENEDLFDVKPIANLQNGDMVAWGIPYVPSIPVSKPAHKEKTVTEVKVTDQTYNALRQIEQGSEKVSQSDVEQFLQQLNTQTSINN